MNHQAKETKCEKFLPALSAGIAVFLMTILKQYFFNDITITSSVIINTIAAVIGAILGVVIIETGKGNRSHFCNLMRSGFSHGFFQKIFPISCLHRANSAIINSVVSVIYV